MADIQIPANAKLTEAQAGLITEQAQTEAALRKPRTEELSAQAKLVLAQIAMLNHQRKFGDLYRLAGIAMEQAGFVYGLMNQAVPSMIVNNSTTQGSISATQGSVTAGGATISQQTTNTNNNSSKSDSSSSSASQSAAQSAASSSASAAANAHVP